MGFKDWLKDHSVGIIIALVIILGLFLLMFFFASFGNLRSSVSIDSASRGMESVPGGSMGKSAYTYQNAMADFAPEVQDRKIETTASLSEQIPRGTFADASTSLHGIVRDAEGFVVNENVQEYQGAKSASYNLRIPADKYATAIAQLKAIGEVTAFTENARDVTGAVVNNDIELTAEKSRLARLQALYTERSSLDDKLRLESAIFDQERKVKYLEDSLTRLGQDIGYSTVTFTLREKPSSLAGLSFLAFGDLVKTFVLSLKGLLYFLAAVLPWAVLIGAIIFAVIWLKRRR